MIRDMLVLVEPAGTQPAAELALPLAAKLDSHVLAVAFAQLPIYPAYGLGMGEVPPAYFEEQWERTEKDTEAALASIEARAQRTGARLETRLYKREISNGTRIFAAEARTQDLVVVGQPDPDVAPLTVEFLEAALFESGRPVLVAPRGYSGDRAIETATIAWNGSAQAARAVHDALPLLKLAKRVEIVTIEAGRGDGARELPAADLAAHLARHGLDVSAWKEHAPASDTGDVLLARLAETGAGLLVMGGFGHFRLREFFFGGVTDTVLAQAGIPVLMAH